MEGAGAAPGKGRAGAAAAGGREGRRAGCVAEPGPRVPCSVPGRRHDGEWPRLGPGEAGSRVRGSSVQTCPLGALPSSPPAEPVRWRAPVIDRFWRHLSLLTSPLGGSPIPPRLLGAGLGRGAPRLGRVALTRPGLGCLSSPCGALARSWGTGPAHLMFGRLLWGS